MPINRDRILYEDPQLLAVNKLSGELVVKGAGRVDKLPLLDFLKQEYPGLRPLNRLDFETSGVVLFARTKQAFEAMVDQTKLEEPDILKTYRALLAGRGLRDHGEITKPLPPRTGKGTVPAKTAYRVLERYINSLYVEADIVTGRYHQIRRHFAGIGHALVLDWEYGDEKYNRVFQREFRLARFFLHAWRVRLTHPITGENLIIEAPMPMVFEGILKKLRALNRA